MTSKTELKITRRQVDNLRAESMRYASYLMSRLRMSVLGKPAIETCKCGEEYELFPNQPTKLDTAQVNAIKFDVDKIYPGIVEEELDKVTHEVKSVNEQLQDAADAFMDKSNERTIEMFTEQQREAAERIRGLLDKYLSSNAMPLNTGNKDGVQTRH
jgi:hypothetical protein